MLKAIKDLLQRGGRPRLESPLQPGAPHLALEMWVLAPTRRRIFFPQKPQQNRVSSPCAPQKSPNPHRTNHFPPKNTWHSSFPPTRIIKVGGNMSREQSRLIPTLIARAKHHKSLIPEVLKSKAPAIKTLARKSRPSPDLTILSPDLTCMNRIL